MDDGLIVPRRRVSTEESRREGVKAMWDHIFPDGEPAEETPPEPEKPTAMEPLRGLEFLPKLSLVGRGAIREKAAAPIPYVWQDIAVLGTIVGINGSPGGGKTTLLFLVLAARMTTGEPLRILGRTVTPAPPGMWIVLIEGEHGEGSTARKLVKTCALLGVDESALDRIVVVARKAVKIGSAAWDDVRRMVAAGIVSDIALDTIARCAPADANDEQQQVAIFDAIAATIETAPSEGTKPTVWSVGHMRKGGGDSIDDVSGSAQRTGQADSVLLVKGEKVGGQTVSSTVTFIKLREEPDDYPQPVTFAIAKDATGRRFIQSDEDKPADDAPLEARILAELVTGPKTKTALSKKLGRNKEDVDGALSTLFGERRITTTEIKVGGRPFRAFEARPEHRTEHRTQVAAYGAAYEHRTPADEAE